MWEGAEVSEFAGAATDGVVEEGWSGKARGMEEMIRSFERGREKVDGLY